MVSLEILTIASLFERIGSDSEPSTLRPTLAEFNLNAWNGMDFYDVSLVEGNNLPMWVNSYSSKSQDMMEGAVWRDPERVDEWIGELSKTEPVVTFCVYGFHIGCETAATLRKAGFDARYMSGGHYAWKAIKGPVKFFE